MFPEFLTVEARWQVQKSLGLVEVSEGHQVFFLPRADCNKQIDFVADRPLDVKLAFSRLYLLDNLFHGQFPMRRAGAAEVSDLTADVVGRTSHDRLNPDPISHLLLLEQVCCLNS